MKVDLGLRRSFFLHMVVRVAFALVLCLPSESSAQSAPAPVAAEQKELKIGKGQDAQWRAYSPRETRPIVIYSNGTKVGENEWACQTSNCTGLPNCQIKNIEDTRAYACQSFQSGKTCIQALEPDGQMQIRLDDTDKREVKTFYQYVDHTADCEKMDKWQQAWSSTALWVDKGRGSIRHSFKILPTVSLGIPLVKGGNQDAQNAIKGLGALAGLTARYSPFGFYLSLDGFVGTATVSSSDLNRDVYKNPATLIGGLGVGALTAYSGCPSIGRACEPTG